MAEIHKDFFEKTSEYETGRALAEYSKTVQAAQEAQELLERTQSFIDSVNAGLPEGCVVATTTRSDSPIPESADYDTRRRMEHIGMSDRGTVVYAQNPAGELIEMGEVVTHGRQLLFIGDKIIVQEQGLVIFNSDLNIGVPAANSVEVMDLENDPNAKTMGGTSLERFNQTLKVLAEAKPGEVVTFDLGWY